jgi:hypothetical protein
MIRTQRSRKDEWHRLCQAMHAPRKNADDYEILERYGYYDPWAIIPLAPPPVEAAAGLPPPGELWVPVEVTAPVAVQCGYQSECTLLPSGAVQVVLTATKTAAAEAGVPSPDDPDEALRRRRDEMLREVFGG